jgi:nitrate/nitrite-specific signal transduction histidine kinase
VAVGVRRITKPVTELIGAAQEVAGGNFGQTITAPTGDEIEELAEQFNLMAAELQESYAHLERRVADRTKELAALNAIAGTVSQSLDLDEILDDALDKTLQVMEIEAGGIYLLDVREPQSNDEEAGALAIAAQRGLSPQFVAEIDRLRAGEGFVGRVAQSGQPLVVRNVSTDPRLTRMMAREEGPRSLASVPLSSKGKVLGVLFAVTRGYREFTDQDVQLLTSIGHQIGMAVENARLFGQAEQRMGELEALYRADAELHRHLRLGEVLQALVDIAVDILRADKSSLMVWDDEREKLGVRVARGLSPETLAQMSFARGEGTVGHVAATGEPVIVEDARTDPRAAQHTTITEREGIHSFMQVPIKVGGEVFGVFSADYTQPRDFGDDEQRLFIALAQRAALAIDRAQLYEQSQELAVVEERGRLARDLHDAVTQTLFSASLIAEALPHIWEGDQVEGQQLLAEMRRLSRGALAEMRTLLLELRPAALVEADLGDLLRQLAEAVTGRTGVPVMVTVEGQNALPPDVHVALYRITQEALNNVVKHAHATRVAVGLRCPPSADGEEGGSIELRVSDNGCGFDPSCVPPDRLGLGIIRERAQAIGATLKIESQPGHGTQVMIVWKDENR